MAAWFVGLSHPLQALFATLFTWGVTALGAAMVFFFKGITVGPLIAGGLVYAVMSLLQLFK